ncbi:hypothetical protein [Streptomyces sp. NPDC048611]|uniref:hypothetical protein n=1 Tax=Streptomyces sp. NPDC048611 TaxID=3155635 RepID=UPI00343611A4
MRRHLPRRRRNDRRSRGDHHGRPRTGRPHPRPADRERLPRTGFGEIWRWCALFFLGRIVAAPGVPFAATGILPSRGQAVAVGRLIAGTRASAWMQRLVLGGAGGAALSLYLAWIF